MAFRDDVRRALAAPLGGPLGRLVHVPAVTALVADGRDPAHEREALGEVIDALFRVGVPRGRQFVLLAHAGDAPAQRRDRTRTLREALGISALAHDPDRPQGFAAGMLADGTPVELDDELREAEVIVLAGRMRMESDGTLAGGPAMLWPGLGARGAASGEGRHARIGVAVAREVLTLVAVALAVFWDDAEPPRVRAGDALAVLDDAVGAGRP